MTDITQIINLLWNRICYNFDKLNKSFMTKLFKVRKKEETDFDKIKVTSSGSFFMRSSDIFDNKEESLKLISKLRNSVKLYSKQNVVATIKK
jgi:hypothetical protein